MKPPRLFVLLRHTVRLFLQTGGPLVSAATAFYAFLSAAPLALAAVALSGVVFGRDAARQELYDYFYAMGGEEAAVVAGRWLESTRLDFSEWASVGGALVTLFAASRLFAATQRALNQIWGVRVRSDSGLPGVARMVARRRALAFVWVLGAGVALTAVIGGKAVVETLRAFTRAAPSSVLSRLMETSLTVAVTAVVFAGTLKALPDARVAWRDAWIGATVTALLFSFGSWLTGLYTLHVTAASAYGAAGTLTVILLWFYYCCLVFFWGAAFTRAWAERYGAGIEPRSYAQGQAEA